MYLTDSRPEMAFIKPKLKITLNPPAVRPEPAPKEEIKVNKYTKRSFFIDMICSTCYMQWVSNYESYGFTNAEAKQIRRSGSRASVLCPACERELNEF
jgi:hypothetical protein